jgi:septal ring factor EnvC (AmiA/AmiB activator)
VSGEHKSIQLQQKIIHLKSEVDKYKTLVASLASSEEWLHLHEQIDQLKAENDELTTKCQHYEDALSRQTDEIKHLSETLERTSQENESLREEIEQFKTEYAYWKEQAELRDEHIQSLRKEVDMFKQKQAEWDKERRRLEEEKQLLENELSVHRSLRNEYVSFQSTLDSLTSSWKERIGTMEKDYSFLKNHTDRILRDVEELKKTLATHQPETDELKEEVHILAAKLHAMEEKLAQIDQERQKDLLVLQKHILNQQVELESMIEKTSHFSTEIKRLSNQIADLTKAWSEQTQEYPHNDMDELKNMLSQIIQLLTANHDTPSEAHQASSSAPVNPSPTKKQTEKRFSSSNTFLKLQEFIDETKQSIVVSPVKTKESHTFNSSTVHLSPQKPNLVKRVRIEHPSYHHRHPSQHKSSLEEDEDRALSSAVPCTFLERDIRNDYDSDSIVEHVEDVSPPEAEARDESTNESETLPSYSVEIEPPLDEANLSEHRNSTTETTPHEESAEAIHQTNDSENENHQNSEEPPVLTNDQETPIKMEDDVSTQDISANEQRPHAEAHHAISLVFPAAFVHPPSASMESEDKDEDDTMVQSEESFVTEEGNNQKWRLFSLLKKVKILQ